jgi:hypothetical protein
MSLLESARTWLAFFQERLAALGVLSSPDLTLTQGRHLLCVYELETQSIAISFPDPGEPRTAFHRLMLRSLLGCSSDEELTRFLDCLLPHVVAHELVHHLRHFRGLMTDQGWHEEEVANQGASALTDRLYSAADLAFVLPILQRSRGHLGASLTGPAHPLQPIARYMLDQIEWLYHDLTSSDRRDLAAFAHRNLAADPLPVQRSEAPR